MSIATSPRWTRRGRVDDRRRACSAAKLAQMCEVLIRYTDVQVIWKEGRAALTLAECEKIAEGVDNAKV